MDPTRELADRIERLEEKLGALERLPDLAPTGTEVPELRAQRLVIVDGNGEERVVIETVAETSSVLVRVPGVSGVTTGVELFASPAADGDRAVVGGCVLRDGDVVEMWSSR